FVEDSEVANLIANGKNIFLLPNYQILTNAPALPKTGNIGSNERALLLVSNIPNSGIEIFNQMLVTSCGIFTRNQHFGYGTWSNWKNEIDEAKSIANNAEVTASDATSIASDATSIASDANAIANNAKSRVDMLSNATLCKWLGSKYEVMVTPIGYNPAVFSTLQFNFENSNPIDNPTIKIGDEICELLVNGNVITANRIINNESCFGYKIGSKVHLFGLDGQFATLEEALVGISKVTTITPAVLKQFAAIFEANLTAKLTAYVDNSVNSTEVVELFPQINGTISTTKPSGIGTAKSYNLSTTEILLDTFNYTLQNGILLAKNNYKFLAYFSNLSTSRITSIRVTYEVKNSLVFDKIFVLENNLSTYQL
ncbi:MAG: alanine-zipper protein, partial [Lactobacillus panisapium]